MLTPLEREQLEALKNLKAIVDAMRWGQRWPGRPHAECDAAEHVIAKAEAKERESAQAAHDRMIALRNAEDRIPPDSLWQPSEAGPDDGEFLGLR